MIWNLRQGCVMVVLGLFLMVPLTSLSEEVVKKLVSNADTKPINVAVDGEFSRSYLRSEGSNQVPICQCTLLESSLHFILKVYKD